MLAWHAEGGPFDAPAGYYSTATGTGPTLKNQLHAIIDDHRFFSYGDARSILQVTDQDPNDPDRMLLVYDRTSLDVSAINPTGSIPGWDFGVSWNREHTWPRSRGVGSSGDDNSDLHQLRPSDNSINNSRGNLNFGGEFGAQSFGIVSDVGGSYWYPGDADAGMIARQEFYMAVRYDGSDSNTSDLELQPGNPSSNLGNLNRLVEWHYEVAPDDFERRRNHVIYDDYQENRNPFVDHPEYVWSLFVDQANDTQLSVAGSQELDLGRVYVGGATPVAQSVTIDKGGVDGTYYSVTTSGNATTTAGEYARPLATGTGVSDSFDVGLNASTALSGTFSGSVVVDNLDITTGAASRGGNDPDDVIDLSFTVLDQPVASFAQDAIVTSQTIDFGMVELGSGLVEQTLSLFNYDGPGGPALAADLDLDSLAGLGDTGALSLDLESTLGIDQGVGVLFDVMFDTTVTGTFGSTYTFNLSGEDLPGEQQQSLTLTLLGEVIDVLQGDYNNDGLVDAADYTLYRDTLDSTTHLAADGDNSGVIDAGDYTVWADSYGNTSPETTVVPEPTSLGLLFVGIAGAIRCRPRCRRRLPTPISVSTLGANPLSE